LHGQGFRPGNDIDSIMVCNYDDQLIDRK